MNAQSGDGDGGDQPPSSPSRPAPYVYNSATSSRYDASEFKGILIDSGAAARSTGGAGQLQALQRVDSKINLDAPASESHDFIFGVTEARSKGTVRLDTPIGEVVSHIVDINTPFLLCLTDMDEKRVFYNNITD